jgi:hypothetical protein
MGLQVARFDAALPRERRWIMTRSKKPPQDPGQLAEELVEIVIVLENE